MESNTAEILQPGGGPGHRPRSRPPARAAAS